MRSKFVLSLLLLLILVVAAAVFLKQHSSPANPEPVKPPVVAATVAPAPILPAPMPAPTPAPVVTKTLTPDEREAAIEAEKNQLDTWSMNDDPQSLSNILNDLTSPEKEIRMAAIEATKQFGSTNAIPVLKADAVNSDDTEEQIAMLEAADFISLPDVVLSPKDGSQTPKSPAQIQAEAQSKAKAQARQQTYIQSHHPDQTSQSTPPANSPDTAPNN